MAKVLLAVTGSVAAIKTPELYEKLRRSGHEVKVLATRPALYFFDPAGIGSLPPAGRNPEAVILDADEWPGFEQGRRYNRDDPVLHIELRRWADLMAIAPLDANTLAKVALGLADNCLTCVWRAWDRSKPVVLAPAMNTLMWENPLTLRHLRLLTSEGSPAAAEPDAESLIASINRTEPWLRILSPVSKRLACGDEGMGAVADLDGIVAEVNVLCSARA